MTASPAPIPVAHVMRTYGVHGGERQLAQLFRGETGEYANAFCFVYRNPVCGEFFARIPALKTKILLGVNAPSFPSLAAEMMILLLLLPVLQIQMLLALRAGGHRICVAHGVQAAMVCWPAALVMRHIRFVYVHRGTKSQAGSITPFRWLYRAFDVVAGVSVASARSLQPLVKDQVIALENGIDWRGFTKAAEACPPAPEGAPPSIMAIGRLLPGKGHEPIIRAFAIVVNRHPGTRLKIAGDGPERSAFETLAAELGIAGQVDFLGQVSDIACRLNETTIFAHASESEGMSNATLEAMCLAKPSVVMDAPGVSECHVDGVTGFVVERRPEAMAEKIVALLDDPGLATRLGEAARERVVTHYSIEANVRRYHALYARILETG